jgi:hypothetical protein
MSLWETTQKGLSFTFSYGLLRKSLALHLFVMLSQGKYGIVCAAAQTLDNTDQDGDGWYWQRQDNKTRHLNVVHSKF